MVGYNPLIVHNQSLLLLSIHMSVILRELMFLMQIKNYAIQHHSLKMVAMNTTKLEEERRPLLCCISFVKLISIHDQKYLKLIYSIWIYLLDIADLYIYILIQYF